MEHRTPPFRRRHRALGGASYSFLRPPLLREDDDRFRERLRTEPGFRRQVRATLLVQLTVVGALFLASLTLVVQALVLLRRMGNASSGAWVLPVAVGFLALLVLRRFLRLVADFRSLDRE